MTFKVEVTAMQSQLNDKAIHLSGSFFSHEEAYEHYNDVINEFNLSNAEYSDSEMSLEAGGIGFDVRVKLVVSE